VKKSVVIRADAGGFTGTGHIMRMMALAQACVRRGIKVVIASIRCPKNLVYQLNTLGIEHFLFEVSELGDEKDAEATIKLARDIGADWLVVDGYHFEYDFQKRVKKADLALLCVDDYGYSDRWCCDAVLNQNLDADRSIKYQNDFLEPKILAGASFCLLREEFLKESPTRAEWGRIERLLVTLGGSDPENTTKAVLELLNQACACSLKIRVLVGVDNRNVETLQTFESHHQVEVVQNVSNMLEQYGWADGIISAGGSTCWEWLYLGLPAAIVTIAENQCPIVRALTEERRAALSLGWFNGPSFGTNMKQLAKWIDSPAEVCDAKIGRQLIDGRGADRVAALFNHRLEVNIITTSKSWLMCDIDILCQDLEKLGHSVAVATKPEDLGEGDILLILSYWNLLSDEALSKHVHNLVVHESALPEGKGWSPLTWQVLEGKKQIPITLFEATKKVDTGDIYLQKEVRLKGHELIDEIRLLQAQATFDLCREFIENYPQIVATKQAQSGEETFYPRRGPKESCLDPEQTISDQFNLLRVVDNESYPAFFDYNNHRYVLKIERHKEV